MLLNYGIIEHGDVLEMYKKVRNIVSKLQEKFFSKKKLSFLDNPAQVLNLEQSDTLGTHSVLMYYYLLRWIKAKEKLLTLSNQIQFNGLSYESSKEFQKATVAEFAAYQQAREEVEKAEADMKNMRKQRRLHDRLKGVKK